MVCENDDENGLTQHTNSHQALFWHINCMLRFCVCCMFEGGINCITQVRVYQTKANTLVIRFV